MDLLSIAIGDTLTTLCLTILDGYSWTVIRGICKSICLSELHKHTKFRKILTCAFDLFNFLYSNWRTVSYAHKISYGDMGY